MVFYSPSSNNVVLVDKQQEDNPRMSTDHISNLSSSNVERDENKSESDRSSSLKVTKVELNLSSSNNVAVADKHKEAIPDMSAKTLQHDNIKPNKPYLVIHAGPAKTGTTTIQAALSTMKKEGILAKDDCNYGGSLFKLMKETCETQVKKQRHAHNKTHDDASLSDSLRKVGCRNETLQALDPYLKSNTNLVFSAESLSLNSHRVYTKKGYAMVDWTSLHLTLSQDWNFLMVFGYRRYYPEWILSSHTAN
jgi:hypothetical protein